MAWATVYAFLRKARAWLLAYFTGAVGFCLLAIYASRGSRFEAMVERTSAMGAHLVAGLVGIPTKVFLDDPGTLLVLIVHQTVGWTAVEIDIECSGLLEIIVFASLLLFFAGFGWRQKAVALLVGIVSTFLMNVVRIVIVVATIHWGGKDAIYIAHTVVGRAIFFVMAMGLYWYVFTRATHARVHERLKERSGS